MEMPKPSLRKWYELTPSHTISQILLTESDELSAEMESFIVSTCNVLLQQDAYQVAILISKTCPEDSRFHCERSVLVDGLTVEEAS